MLPVAAPPQNAYRIWLNQLLIAALYFIFGWLVHHFLLQRGIVSAVWPGSGLALAAVLLGGRRYLIGVVGGALLLNLSANDSVWAGLGITLANGLEVACAAWLLARKERFSPTIPRLSDYLYLLGLGAALASLLGALVGVGTLWLAGYFPSEEIVANLLHWWMGDALGIALLTPFFLAWSKKTVLRLSWSKFIEIVLLLGMTGLIGQVLFLGWFNAYPSVGPRGYWMFLCVTWVALRLGIRGVTVVVIMVAAQALWGAYQGVGLFAQDVIKNELHNFWAYSLTLSIVGMVVSTHVDGIRFALAKLRAKDAALQQSHQQMFSLLNSMAEGAYGVDVQGNCTFVNRAALQMLGYQHPGEIIGKQMHELIHHRHADGSTYPAAECKMYAAFRSNQSLHVADEVFWHRDGSAIPVEYWSQPIMVQGVLQGAIATFIDTTERRQVLDKLRATARELECANAQIEAERGLLAERVLERTAQLQRANHAKDSFLATMSHEIRTPLGGLLGMMELLDLSHLDVKQHELLEAARKSGKSLLRIVNDILDWSKIEAGKLELAPQVASIAETLQSVANTYAQLASEKDIRISWNVDPALAAAHRFDPLRLSQILNNFTSNALKFTERGVIQISAERLAQHGEREQVCFSIRDSGIGITAEQQQRLFLQYEQASTDTARMYGGTGLGLAICRRLAELMGGTLSVSSQAGVGSTFSLTVTLVAAQADPGLTRLVASNAVPDISPLHFDGRIPTVLIVDDHPLNRLLLKQQLDVLGVGVAVAEHGQQALARWQQGGCDLLITDCHMPEMDGYRLTQLIRGEECNSGTHTPVIAWTANVLAEEEEHCRLAGMDDMLTKPTELHELRAKLLKYLSR